MSSNNANDNSQTMPSQQVTTTTPNTTTNNATHEMPSTPTKSGILYPANTANITKKLLPLAAFFMAFATVMTILIIYMDNTAMRHYQFRMNMSQDYELLGVSQDNPQLVTYIREVHLSPAIEPHHKPLESDNSLFDDTAYLLKIMNNKKDGVFVEAGAYGDGKTSRTEYLERKLNWKGLLIQPDPRHYFSLKRHNRVRSNAIHACLSPTPYPKEVTLHQESDGVKINSIHANSLEDPDWFNTRVKCFPLYSILLAMNETNIDYFSLEAGGTELQVLETIPFDRVKITVIGVHLLISEAEKNTIKQFLATKKYKLMQSFNSTYIYMISN